MFKTNCQTYYVNGDKNPFQRISDSNFRTNLKTIGVPLFIRNQMKCYEKKNKEIIINLEFKNKFKKYIN